MRHSSSYLCLNEISLLLFVLLHLHVSFFVSEKSAKGHNDKVAHTIKDPTQSTVSINSSYCIGSFSCKNPYLEGYLEYLDRLVDKQVAEDLDGQVESTAKGDGLGGTEIISGTEITLNSDGSGVSKNGVYYTPEQIEYFRKDEENQAARDAADKARSEEMQKNAEKIQAAINDEQAKRDFLNEIGLG